VPTYTYECKKCGTTFDEFHGISAEPKLKCVDCGSSRVFKLMGTGAGIIFKGSGFYETDYKTKKGTPPENGKSGNGKSESGKGESTSKKAEGSSCSSGSCSCAASSTN